MFGNKINLFCKYNSNCKFCYKTKNSHYSNKCNYCIECNDSYKCKYCEDCQFCKNCKNCKGLYYSKNISNYDSTNAVIHMMKNLTYENMVYLYSLLNKHDKKYIIEKYHGNRDYPLVWERIILNMNKILVEEPLSQKPYRFILNFKYPILYMINEFDFPKDLFPKNVLDEKIF